MGVVSFEWVADAGAVLHRVVVRVAIAVIWGIGVDAIVHFVDHFKHNTVTTVSRVVLTPRICRFCVRRCASI